MAILDLERDVVVIRIVYDGPACAGKTTSVRSLADSLTRTVETPVEVGGRTMYFDWMEYTGGVFEGHRIRCQIVSLPGQPELAARRRALLETADVVIFVADTSDRATVDRSVHAIRQTIEMLRIHGDPPVGVIVQANKRDLPGAVPRDELRAALGANFVHSAITESVAHAGLGIRETFVLGVRLALDRIRALITLGELPHGRPAIDSAQDLLAALDNPRPARGRRPGARRSSPPRLPDTRVQSGAIWPPVDGRMILHEALATAATLEQDPDGGWLASSGSGWQLHSPAAAEFVDFDDGKDALLALARAHAAHAPLLSPSRCVVLAEASAHSWRLWQIIRCAPSLRDWLVADPDLPAPALLDRLAAAASALGGVTARSTASPLAPTLDTVGPGAQFVARLPDPAGTPPLPIADIAGHVTSELAGLLANELARRRAELVEALTEPPAPGSIGPAWRAAIAAALAIPPPLAPPPCAQAVVSPVRGGHKP